MKTATFATITCALIYGATMAFELNHGISAWVLLLFAIMSLSAWERSTDG